MDDGRTSGWQELQVLPARESSTPRYHLATAAVHHDHAIREKGSTASANSTHNDSHCFNWPCRTFVHLHLSNQLHQQFCQMPLRLPHRVHLDAVTLERGHLLRRQRPTLHYHDAAAFSSASWDFGVYLLIKKEPVVLNPSISHLQDRYSSRPFVIGNQ